MPPLLILLPFGVYLRLLPSASGDCIRWMLRAMGILLKKFTCNLHLGMHVLQTMCVNLIVLSTVSRLKQAPPAWFAKFSITIEPFGFTSSPCDSALPIHKSERGTILLLLYVNDVIITGDGGIEDHKSFLCNHFGMKDLSSPGYFSDLDITCYSDGISLSLRPCIFLTSLPVLDSLIAKFFPLHLS